MGLGIGGKFGMFFLITINVLFMLLGLALLIVGIVMKVNVGHTVIDKNEVIQALNEIALTGSLKFGNVASSLSILIICIGGVILAITALGGFGACCKNRCLLVTYAIVVFLIFIVQIIGVALWFTMKSQVENTVKDKLLESMNKYEGYTSTNEISIAWDLLFIGFDCCGIDSVENNQNEFDTTTWWASRPANDKVPYSCCESATEDNYKTVSAGSGETTCTQLTSGYKKTGCYQALKNFLKKYQSGAIGIGIALLVIEFIAVISAFVLCGAIGKADEKLSSPKEFTRI